MTIAGGVWSERIFREKGRDDHSFLLRVIMGPSGIRQTLLAFVETMPNGIVLYRDDDSRQVIYANASALDIFGCDSLDELMDFCHGDFRNLIVKEDSDALENIIKHQEQTRSENLDYLRYHIYNKKTGIHMVENMGRLIHDPEEGDLFIVCYTDAEHRSFAYASDAVTGLPGLREFLDVATARLAEHEAAGNRSSYAIVFFDLSRFKAFNIRNGVDSGDQVLMRFAGIIRENFPHQLIARAADDHFLVLTPIAGVAEAVKRVHETFSMEFAQEGLEARAGIYLFQNDDTTLSAACDLAKMACDDIKHAVDVYYLFYEKKIQDKHDVSDFVVHNIERAVEQHHIKVYYQPVVRTINRSLCGMEALARWEDPEKGLLSPGYFIPALEDSKLISKLDLYMIEEVCSQMRARFNAGKFIVPVSFNLSRIDFITCDIFSEVDRILQEYEIPRDMIRVEITESMMTRDGALVQEVVERFQNAGYQVWMDDFGSGYSSLNLLKDYHFDEIKIDMAFLSKFDDRSRSIVQAIVDMAKQIGIQTLAEGVETKEHFDFLKKIGCEKVQGYYFGKPMPLEDTLHHCEMQGLSMETRDQQVYYDAIGRVDFTTGRPIAIYDYDGENFNSLFANDEYYKVLRDIGISDMENLDDRINSKLSPLTQQFISLHNSIYMEGLTSYTDISIKGHYVRVWAKRLASNNGHFAYQVETRDLTRGEQQKQQDDRDEIFRSMYLTYDGVYVIDTVENRVSNVMNHGLFELDNTVDMKNSSAYDVFETLMRVMIHPGDQTLYKEWLSFDTLKKRIQESEQGYLSEMFRTKNELGAYIWKVHRMMALPGSDFRNLILTINDTPLLNDNTLTRVAKSLGMAEESETRRYANMWQSLVESHIAYLFWKDKNRRFMGANQNFLNFYGISDVSEIVGKTDEDMNWHVNGEQYRDDELDVINNGITVTNRPGKCIVRGKEHMIMATKAPLYDSGKIIGLVGYFIDLDEALGGSDSFTTLRQTDPVSGLANTYGVLEGMAEFTEQWKNSEIPYAAIWLSLRGFHAMNGWYGEEVGNHLLRKAGNVILDLVGRSAVCGRISEANFLLVKQYEDPQEITDMVSELEKRISDIREVDGNEVTVHAETTITLASELGNSEDVMVRIFRV